jgi:exodeoxyribonuclease VII large subunit
MTQFELFPEEEPQTRILSVSELTQRIKDLLEVSFASVCVTGEISDFSRPRSGHCYLTLKDDQAQIRAVLWRTTAARLRFDLHDGLAVVCRGHVDVYAPRGSYQLIVDQIEPRGIGTLELAFRQLRDKLSKEGLFDPARKRPLQRFNRRIGVVTSPTGAAIQDFLQVLARRWRGANVLVVPARVQGEGAAEEVAQGVELLNRLAEPVDCIVVTRGGGSLEDLWAFNEERLVRAIVASRIPVVSAVGHEIDVTLADLAADVRALTPSEAAELVAPAREDIAASLAQSRKRLEMAIRTRTSALRARLEMLARHRMFRRPYQQVQDLARRLDELEMRCRRAAQQRLRRVRQELTAAAAHLESLSPLAVLGRGYSVTRRTSDGVVIRDARDLSLGDELHTRFQRGQALSRVERVERQEGEAPSPPAPLPRGERGVGR